MSVRKGQAAVDWARDQATSPSMDWFGLCLVFTRSAFNVAAKHPDAATAWGKAKFKHSTADTPPLGVPVWWTGGGSGFGHVVVSAGGGFCWSSDIKRRGKVDKVPISSISRAWGLKYQGWTEDLNGVQVFSPATPSLPAVALANVREAFERDFTRPQGDGLHERDTLRVEQALLAEGLLVQQFASNGYAGTLSRSAYAKWQKRSGVGGPFDGIPGLASLTRLGQKHGFRVVR